jgi:hypothetical protein
VKRIDYALTSKGLVFANQGLFFGVTECRFLTCLGAWQTDQILILTICTPANSDKNLPSAKATFLFILAVLRQQTSDPRKTRKLAAIDLAGARSSRDSRSI